MQLTFTFVFAAVLALGANNALALPFMIEGNIAELKTRSLYSEFEARSGSGSTTPEIDIKVAPAAMNDLIGKTKADFGGVDPIAYHVAKVKSYWTANHTDTSIANANKARIRRAAHTGGMNLDEKDHITVSFRKGGTELATKHVYTGR